MIFGVLTTDNQDQAMERSGGNLGNKGRESAIAGLEMASAIRQLQEKQETVGEFE